MDFYVVGGRGRIASIHGPSDVLKAMDGYSSAIDVITILDTSTEIVSASSEEGPPGMLARKRPYSQDIARSR
jgi:hypothetical protein